uniref:FAM192A/Fyv6 N-terminal domain-containing protein n=1 Tax=Lotharella oceanica TaxID=641309 RepID=A0A7S2X6R3_9EUKA|mmetsp:Transcript_11283/g.21645  ORF Transcript_11283/g.21645 Transcript_11283/m.21645 type:complete len:203 (+) Transcript_11283:2279-2887(+)|eukprot:CAMPEP_0170198536 /NCGR_PEP_ID=MMETSP0040_2-20121228/68831_1 /TAXON_ID=641309 /ORGANISM="Lotharella oceanica, Strain CCMP622" /LENGTH=202 /DNA_ID=CAMNT_0010448541 /DNA_START=46 /DNA_END=654 /DNA_ORIENTATION=+
MAFNFVAKAVIRSEDGVTFNKETKIEPKKDEGSKLKGRRKGPIMPIGKSLAEQLQENAEKKDAEWKAANNPFRPPPSMTEEEAEFLQEREMAERMKEKAKQELAEEGASQFKAARLSKVVTRPAEPLPKVEGLFGKVNADNDDKITENKAESDKPKVMVKVKDKKKKKKKKRKKDQEKRAGKKQKDGEEEEAESALSLLSGY